MDQAVLLHRLGLEIGAGLEGVDRLVLGGVILEDAPKIGQQRDQREVGNQQGDPQAALDQHEPDAVLDADPLGQEGR